MRHKKQLFLIFISLSFLLLIPFSRALVHENDINLSWVDPIYYSNSTPSVFTIDDSLNHTIYNSTDYYYHNNVFNSYNYTTDLYIENDTYSLGINPFSVVGYNNSIYLFWVSTSYDIYQYSLNLTLLSTISHDLDSYFDNIQSVSTDGNYIYVMGYDYFNGGANILYKIVRVSYTFEYLEQLFTISDDVYTQYLFYNMVYYNEFLYISCHDVLGGNLGKIMQYDLYGNLITTENIDAEVNYPQGFAYYEGKFYIRDATGDDIHRFDTSFSLIDVLEFEYDVRNFYIYLGVSYVVLTNYDVILLDELFEFQNFYNIIRNYPYNELLEPVENLDLSFEIDTINCDNVSTDLLYHYNGTYSFEWDAISSIPSGWTDASYASCSAQVIAEQELHHKVVELDDNNGAGFAYLYQSMGVQTSGTIESWISIDSVSHTGHQIIETGTTDIIIIDLNNGDLKYYDGSSYTDSGISFSANEWIHLRIDFECGAGSYLGLSADTWNLYVNNELIASDIDFKVVCASVDRFTFLTGWTSNGLTLYGDAVGYSWSADYDIGDNYELYVLRDGFYNELVLMNADYEQLVSIECFSGIYLVNDVNIDHNIFNNITNTWNFTLTINQTTQTGNIYMYDNQTLLFSDNFNSLTTGYVKNIKYIQHYVNSTHHINISYFNVNSDNVNITGNNGFLSYDLELSNWLCDDNTALNITGYGHYRFYISNDTYGNSNETYLLSGWVKFENNEKMIDISFLDFDISNPILIVETMNGMYLIDEIEIVNTIGDIILYDDRGYYYGVSLTYNNVLSNISYFSIVDNKLQYQILYDDESLEYIKLVVDIQNIVNYNYRFYYSTYCNNSNTNLDNTISVRNTDASASIISIDYLYKSDSELLTQEKTTSQIEILISDDNLFTHNTTISGYIDDFLFGYNEQLGISIFFENMILIIVPIIVIITLTVGLAHVFNNDKREQINKEAFFPIFLFSSIIVYAIGFFDTWILFSIIIAGIVYAIKKRGNF